MSFTATPLAYCASKLSSHKDSCPCLGLHALLYYSILFNHFNSGKEQT